MRLRYRNSRQILLSLALTLLTLAGTFSTVYSESTDPVIKKYEEALALNPGDLDIQDDLARALVKKKRYSEALGHLLAVFESKPGDMDISYYLGLTYAALDDRVEALEAFNRVRFKDPERARNRYNLHTSYYNLGVKASNNKSYTEALKLYGLAIEVNPDEAASYCRRGELLYQLNRHEEAGRELKSCKDKGGKRSNADTILLNIQISKAYRYIEEGHTAKAIEEFTKLSEADPENETFPYNLGYLYYSIDNLEEAQRVLTPLATPVENDIRQKLPPLLYNIGLKLQQKEEWLSSIEPLKQAISINRSDPDLHLILANTYLRIDDTTGKRSEYREKGLKAVSEVLALAPNHPDGKRLEAALTRELIIIYKKEGNYLLEHGDYRGALKNFNGLLRLDPGSTVARKGKEKAEEGISGERLKERTVLKELIAEGDRLLALSKPLEARTTFRSALAIEGENEKATLGLSRAESMAQNLASKHISSGDTFKEGGNLYLALKEYRAALALTPDETVARAKAESSEREFAAILSPLLKEAKVMKGKGDLLGAVEKYDEILDLNPGDPGTLKERGRLSALLEKSFAKHMKAGKRYGRNKEYLKGLKEFKKAERLKPDDEEVATSLRSLKERVAESKRKTLEDGDRHLRKGRLLSALTAYKAILEIEKGNRRALDGVKETRLLINDEVTEKMRSGKRALEESRYHKAIKDFNSVLKLDGGNKEARSLSREARRTLDKEVAPLLKSAEAALEGGDEKAAALDLNRVLGRDPDNRRAKSIMERLDRAASREALKKEITKHYLRGIELYTSGKFTAAIESWEKVLDLDPDHVKAKINIEKAAKKLEGGMNVK